MSRSKTFLAVLALVICAFASAQAQSSSSTSNPIALTITPFLSCSPTRGIDFGSVRRIDGPLFTSSTNYAEWGCTCDQGASLNFTFGLPAAMVNPQATGLTVPLSYGTSSAFVDANGVRFNPASGLSNDIVANPGGAVTVRLGWPGSGGQADLIRADISNASTAGGGHYAATVVLNVSVNP